MSVAVLAVIALAGALAVFAALVTLHALPTGLSPFRDPVSAYGISRFRALYRVQTLATSVAAVTLAAALAVAVPDTATPAVISLTLLAVARAIISWFPMDAPDTPATRTGRIHDLLAYAAFAAASVSGFMVAIAFTGDGAAVAPSGLFSALGWVMTAASVGTIVSRRVLPAVFGLAERLIYVGMLAMLIAAPVALIEL